MTFRPVDVYEVLEPLLKDYRKLRYRNQCEYSSFVATQPIVKLLSSAGYHLTYIDEFVDELLNEERVCDLILPRIPKRDVLEENGELAPRQSRLLAAMEGKDEEKMRGRSRSTSRDGSRSSRSPLARSRSRSGPPSQNGRSESRPASRSPGRSLSPAGSDGRFRSRSRSISPDRMQE